MPYISQQERGEIAPYIEPVLVYLSDRIVPPGDLNYIITKLLLAHIKGFRSYARYNEIIGILECVKLEMYWRRVVEFENEKLKENGDVY